MTETPEKNMPVARVVRRQRLSLAWLVPLAAVGLVAAMSIQGWSDRGVLVEISFADGSGIHAGQTALRYQGVVVGKVERVRLRSDLESVIVSARLDRSAAGLARDGATFWVVRASVGLGGVSGLDTLVGGPYIAIAGGDGPVRSRFDGAARPPPNSRMRPGLGIVIEADRLGSLTRGDPLLYRDVRIGEVDSVGLTSDGRGVEIRCLIEQAYAPLVRGNSRFWNVSGVDLSVGIFGGSIEAESLETVLNGGIAMATPNNDDMGEPAVQGDRFTLYAEPKGSWLKWSPSIPLVVADEP